MNLSFGERSIRPDYRQQTLDFCQRWLDGEREFVLHTSGSTGKPKPIVLQREQMEVSAWGTAAAVGLEAGMRSLVCLNTAYVAGVMMLVRGLELGLEMTVIEPSRGPLAGWGERRFDFVALVPLQVEAALRSVEERRVLEGMHAVLIGGAPVSERLEANLQGVTAACFHTYGMTETVSHVALRRLNGRARRDRFEALPGVGLRLDERGCLVVRGPMTLGAEVVTNDRVEIVEHGFRWIGRIDNVINSGGVKVQAEKVERVLRRVVNGRLFVTGLPDEEFGEVVTAVIEGENHGDLRERLIADTPLSRYEVPRRFLYVDAFAETPTGKVDRVATLKRV